MRRLPVGYALTFSELYEEVTDFTTDYGTMFPDNLKPGTPALIYNLLMAKYGAREFNMFNVYQIKLRIFSLIWQYGPAWEKELDIQTNIRALTSADLAIGRKSIANHALNPSTAPSTGALTELDKIDEQNTVTAVKAPIEGYAAVIAMLKEDVTEKFLDRFAELFTRFRYNLTNQYFVNPEEEEDEE